MKRKLTSILLMSALLVGGASTFVSCKDYDGDQAAVSNANVKGLSDKLNEQITALEALKTDINTKLNGKADQSVVDALDLKVGNAIADLQNQINAIKSCECDLTDLLATQAFVNSIKDDLTALLAKDLVTSDQLKDWLTEDDITTLRTGMDALNTLFGPNLEDAVIRADLADYAKSADLSKYALATDLNSYLKTENFSGQLVSTLNTLLANSGLENITDVTELFAQIDKIAGMDESIQKLASECALLAGKYSLLNDKIDSLVTGVNVDMVSNPIYGTFNTPFGIKSYVLAGFVGGQIEGQEFAGQDVEGGLAASANGGSIYLTVNPTDLDAEGWNIGSLVGRDGKLAPGYGELVLVADNTPVTTTKAAAQGGYVATPKLVDPAAAKINVNKEELTAVAKNVLGKLRGEEALDITGAVQTIYNTFSKAIDQYYGINVKYGKNGEHSFQSSYDIAPVTVKPLAYTTLADKNFRDIPQIPSLQDKLGAVITNIKYDPIDASSIKDFEFVVTSAITDENEGEKWNDKYTKITVDEEAKTITIPFFDDTASRGEYWAYKWVYNEGWWNVESKPVTSTANYSTITIPYSKIKIEKVNPAGDEWGTNWTWEYNEETQRWEPVVNNDKWITKYTVTISHDEMKSIVNEMNTQMGGIVEDVNNMFDNVSDMASAIDDRLEFVNKFINKLNYTVDHINKYLQPIAIAVCDGGKAVRLSEVPGCYTQFKVKGNEGSIVIALTSYTAELLAPAYKKSVKIDNTTELNPSLDGSVKKVVATLGVGTHTITVSSMDFYGNIRTKNYYVQVVK
ncbi:MAG: hypothetical protein MST01_04030 [Prevotella sp.]|nr:hypothetical protein [Prevotella sp.]